MNHMFLLIANSCFLMQTLSGPYSYYDIDFTNYHLEDYCVITTHNAYSSGYVTRAQAKSINTQLADGVRGFMLDTYHRNVDGDRIVMCHASECQLKFLDSTLQKLVNHLSDSQALCHEDPIIAVFLEDYVEERDRYRRSFSRVDNLVDYAFNPYSSDWSNSRNGKTWPTVDEICSTKQRLLLFTDNGQNAGYYSVNDADDVYVMLQKNWRVENEYNIGNSIGFHDKLTCVDRAGSFSVDSGSIKADGFNWLPLFIMNHFHQSPEEIHSLYDNSFDQLWKRYKIYCEPESEGKLPNFLAVDFYNRNRKDTQNFLSFMMQKSGLILFEGNDISQDALCYIPTTKSVSYNLEEDDLGCDRDEARSMLLTDVVTGTVIVVTDSPNGLTGDGGEDDFTIIYVKQDIGSYFDGKHYSLDSFQIDTNGDFTYEDDYILAFYNRNGNPSDNSLDGKVSNVQIKLLGDDFTVDSPVFYEDGNAKITLYEGNSATENTVCTLDIDYIDRDSEYINFKDDDLGCDNDETRSLKITKALVGTRIRLYDSPDGSPDDDDWVDIKVLKSFRKPKTIKSYETSFDNEFFEVTYHSDNGLDGKVSSIVIDPPPRTTTFGDIVNRRRIISSNAEIPVCFAGVIRSLFTEKTTTQQPIYDSVDLVIGEKCYCRTNIAPTKPKSKGSKSKHSKSKSKHTKSKHGKSQNVNYKRHCDCEGGLIALTLMYRGIYTVNIEWYNKDSILICIDNNVDTGDEITCNAKLDKDTYVTLMETTNGEEICQTKIHTSCSQDIIGTYGDRICGADVIVTGWKDKNNLECDDGYQLCNCNGI